LAIPEYSFFTKKGVFLKIIFWKPLLKTTFIKNISHVKRKFLFESLKMFLGRPHLIGDCGEAGEIHTDDNFPKF
jgi:hypothetical protein